MVRKTSLLLILALTLATLFDAFSVARADGGVASETHGHMTICGANDNDYAGYAVASGDVNGDGLEDVIVGAFRADGPDDGRKFAGRVYVVFGPADVYGMVDLASKADVVIYGADARDYAGSAVASGDVNGDGFADIVIGAEWADGLGPGHRREDAGEVYVVLGSDSLPTAMEMYGQADLIIYGEEKRDHVGHSVAVGDLNRDQLGDILVGAVWTDGPGNDRPQAGGAYVVLSSERFRSRMCDLRTGSDLIIFGADTQDRAGTSVASGDVNGDGYDDLLVGATYADGPDNGRTWAGEVHVVLGSDSIAETSHMKSVDLREQADLTVYGADRGDRAGISVASADVNADGCDEIVVGASFAGGVDDSQSEAGEARIVMGSPAIGGILDLAYRNALTIWGTDAGDQAGTSVATGDVDGDGLADIIVGAHSADGPNGDRQEAGEAHVISPRIIYQWGGW